MSDTKNNAKNKSKMSGNSRLCHITKWENFDGYGFDLHAEKGKPGQYIGKVDDGSPAQAAGLRHGDRILEVNGESISGKTHREVVELIKAVVGETKLLVVDGDDVTSSPSSSPVPPPVIENSNNVTNGHHMEKEKSEKQMEKEPETPKENGTGTLNLNMTAAELRARLAARKKFDPKKESMDFKKKFDIIQKL